MRSPHRGTRHLAAIAFVAGILLSSAPAAHATWVGDNCRDGASDRSSWKRSDAFDYAQPARREGYEWNGGCYKLNDRDDTEGWPVDAEGEGADCSGFVFKVWALKRAARPGSGAGTTRWMCTAPTRPGSTSTPSRRTGSS